MQQLDLFEPMANVLEIVIAGFDDIPDLIALAYEANEESSYGWGFDSTTARDYLAQYLKHEEADILLALINNQVVGATIICQSVEFDVTPVAYLNKFWVSKEGRRTPAARLLMDCAIKWAEGKECGSLFVTATAGLASIEQKLFTNLLAKVGFEHVGPVMMVEIN